METLKKNLLWVFFLKTEVPPAPTKREYMVSFRRYVMFYMLDNLREKVTESKLERLCYKSLEVAQKAAASSSNKNWDKRDNGGGNGGKWDGNNGWNAGGGQQKGKSSLKCHFFHFDK